MHPDATAKSRPAAATTAAVVGRRGFRRQGRRDKNVDLLYPCAVGHHPGDDGNRGVAVGFYAIDTRLPTAEAVGRPIGSFEESGALATDAIGDIGQTRFFTRG